jgi:hypothetical protein
MLRKKEKKTDLHVTITPIVIDYFEELRNIHKRDYSEFIESKLLELISEVAPEYILEMKLKAAEKEVSDLKEAMINLKTLKIIDFEKQKAEKEIKNLRESAEKELQDNKEKQYIRYFETLKFQSKNGINHDWSTIIKDFGFKSKAEAVEWVYDREKVDGIRK